MLSRFHLISEHNGRQTDRRTDLLYQYHTSVLVTNLIHDFTAVTFSVKNAHFHVSVKFREIRDFS